MDVTFSGLVGIDDEGIRINSEADRITLRLPFEE